MRKHADDASSGRNTIEMLTHLRSPLELSLSTSDAAYLELAVRERLPIATLDDGIQDAAIAIGVPLYKR